MGLLVDVAFLPSPLLTHPFSGRGSVEVGPEGLRVTGRRLWPLQVRLVLALPVLGLLFVAGARFALVVAALFSGAVCRSTATETIPLARVSDARVLGPRRAQFRFVPEGGRGRRKVVFAGEGVDALVRELEARQSARPR